MELRKGWVKANIEQLVKADWNYKEDDQEKAIKLKNNIKRNGQIENIIIRELDTGYYEVINGNHRLDVMQELDFKKIMTYNFGKITQQQAMRIAIETNETKFPADTVKLSEIIREISTEFNIEDLVETLPFTEQQIEAYDKLIDFDWSQFEKVDVNKDGTYSVTISAKTKEKLDNAKRNLRIENNDKALSFVLENYAK